MFQTKLVEKIEKHFMVNNFFPKILPFMKYVGKYDTARKATDDNIIGGMRFECWKNEAKDMHSEYVILISSPRQEKFFKIDSILRCAYTSCLVMTSQQGSCEVHCKIIRYRTK